MKKTVTTLLAVLFATALAAQDIDLPAPHRTRGMPLMEALANRHSSRDFDSRELPKQTLSDLLWAAWGYNRADKRTAPSSRDKQEIELYVHIPADTRSAFPVISVQSPVSIQCCWQS